MYRYFIYAFSALIAFVLPAFSGSTSEMLKGLFGAVVEDILAAHEVENTTIGNILSDPNSRGFMDAATHNAECLALSYALYPNFIVVGDEQGIFPVIGLEALSNVDATSVTGPGRGYEIYFEYGEDFSEEQVYEFSNSIFMFSAIMQAALEKSVSQGHSVEQHEALFHERRMDRFSFTLGFASTAPHEVVYEQLVSCQRMLNNIFK